jgi:hypothetical protein
MPDLAVAIEPPGSTKKRRRRAGVSGSPRVVRKQPSHWGETAASDGAPFCADRTHRQTRPAHVSNRRDGRARQKVRRTLTILEIRRISTSRPASTIGRLRRPIT